MAYDSMDSFLGICNTLKVQVQFLNIEFISKFNI